jgi:hypothetical protein
LERQLCTKSRKWRSRFFDVGTNDGTGHFDSDTV